MRLRLFRAQLVNPSAFTQPAIGGAERGIFRLDARQQMRIGLCEDGEVRRSSAPPKDAGNHAASLGSKVCITKRPPPLPIV